MSQYDNNDIDRLLQGAFDSRPRGAGGSPSMVDVRHRARRHQRRRVGGVVGATAMLGVSGVAVLASRGSSESGIAGDAATTTSALTAAGPLCGYTPVDAFPATTIQVFEEPTTTIIGPATTSPSEATSTVLDTGELPLPAGCTPSGQYRCVGNTGMDDQGYTYFDYCEPVNPGDSSFPYPTTTTAVDPVATMPDYTTYEVFDTTTTLSQLPTTTESEFVPTTVMATTTT